MLPRPLLVLALVLLPVTSLFAASAEPARGGGDPFVNVAGDVMTGDLDLGSHALVLGDASLHSPAAGLLRFGGEDVCFTTTCAPPTTFDWSALTGVPAGFADGVDAVDGGIAAGLSCVACVDATLLAFDPADQNELDEERDERELADAALDTRLATLENASAAGPATDLSCTQCVELEELAFKAATVKALDNETVARETADAALEARVAALEQVIAAAGGRTPEGYVLLDLGDGSQPYGPLPFYGGCREEGTVAMTTDSTGQRVRQVASTTIVPCRIGVGPGMGTFFFMWLGDAMEGIHPAVDLELIPITGKGAATQHLLLDEARITGMELPRLASGQPAWLEVELLPGAILKTGTTTCCVAAVPVDPITDFALRTTSGPLDLVGVGPIALAAPAPFLSAPEWSDVQLRGRATNASTMAALEMWLKDTLSTGVEHDVKLTLQASKSVSQTLELYNLGLFRRADLFVGADGGIGFDGYVEYGEIP